MRLEEEWDTANAADIGELSSITDLTLIEELSSQQMEEEMEAESRERRREAVQRDKERHRLSLRAVAVADDAQDELIQLWRRQVDSSDTESEPEALDDAADAAVSEAESSYSDNSDIGSQLTGDGVERTTRAVSGSSRSLVVKTRAMRRRERRERNGRAEDGSLETRRAMRKSAAETELSATSEAPSRSESSSTQRAPLEQPRPEALRVEVTPAPQPLSSSEAANERTDTAAHRAATLARPPTPSLPVSPAAIVQPACPPPGLHQPVAVQPSSATPERLEAASACRSQYPPEPVTLAEHAALSAKLLLQQAKNIRRDGRKAHEQQQAAQRLEQQSREQSDTEQQAVWLQWASSQLRRVMSKVERKRVQADAPTTKDSDHDSIIAARTAQAGDKRSGVCKPRSAPSHRRGGRYSQLPGMTTAAAAAQPQARRHDKSSSRHKRQKKKEEESRREKEWEEDDETVQPRWRERQQRQRQQQRTSAPLRPSSAADFFPPAATTALVDDGGSTAEVRRSSVSNNVSTASTVSAPGSASTRSASPPLPREERAKQQGARTAFLFSHLRR